MGRSNALGAGEPLPSSEILTIADVHKPASAYARLDDSGDVTKQRHERSGEG
jgi:hypothetical protein